MKSKSRKCKYQWINYYLCTYKQQTMIIEEILKYNREFVEKKGYERFLTSKYPDKKLAILSCMDTRLTELLPAALGIKNGDAKLIKNAGGLVISPFDSAMRSILVAIYELHVEEIMVIAHSNCGACHMNGKAMKQAMMERGIRQDVIDTVAKCDIDLDHWLEGLRHGGLRAQHGRRNNPPSTRADRHQRARIYHRLGDWRPDRSGITDEKKRILFMIEPKKHYLCIR